MATEPDEEGIPIEVDGKRLHISRRTFEGDRLFNELLRQHLDQAGGEAEQASFGAVLEVMKLAQWETGPLAEICQNFLLESPRIACASWMSQLAAASTADSDPLI